MTVMYLRNVKKGFATNSSSYHSTLTRFIDVPESVWVQFKEQENNTQRVETSNGAYSLGGITLTDDEYRTWHSYKEIQNEFYEVQSLGVKADGKAWVRIIIETEEENDY